MTPLLPTPIPRGNRSGFTLIELVLVLIILGILAAMGMSRYADVGAQARDSAKAQVAASITSASGANLAAFKAGSPDAVALGAQNVCTAPLLSRLLQGGALPQISGNPVLAPPPSGPGFGGPGDCSSNTGNLKAVCNMRVFNADTGLIETFPAEVYCAR